MTIEQLIADREKMHGDWERQAQLSQSLKACVALSQEPIRTLSKGQREAIEMILVKISRICNGDPDDSDHWLDIQGYAKLGGDSAGLTDARHATMRCHPEPEPTQAGEVYLR
jgi:hypothetical protein